MTHRVLVVVSGGLRSPSSTRILADGLAASSVSALEAAGDTVEVRTIELREHAHAVADALLTGFPSGALADALRDVLAADALIAVTPTFQASYSGLFKSFLDLVEAGSIRGVPVLLGATGGTERHSLVIESAMRPLFAYLGALTVPTGVYAATADFGGDGSARLETRIDRAAGELAGLVAGRPPRAELAPAAPELVPFAELLARGVDTGRGGVR